MWIKWSALTVFAMSHLSASALCQQISGPIPSECEISTVMVNSKHNTSEEVEILRNSRLNLVENALDIVTKYKTTDNQLFTDVATPEDKDKLKDLKKQILLVNAKSYILDEQNRDIQILGGILDSDMKSGSIKPSQDTRQIHLRDMIEHVKKEIGSALKPLNIPNELTECDFNSAVIADYRVIIRKLIRNMEELNEGIEWLGTLYAQHSGENGNIDLDSLSADEQKKYQEIQELDKHSVLTVGVLSDLGILQKLYAFSNERVESEKAFLQTQAADLSSIEDLDKAFFDKPRDGIDSMMISILQYIMEKYPSSEAVSIKLFDRLLDPNRHY